MLEVPLYQKIAIDIAQKITLGEFAVGHKISGRSMLSGNYKVSPETIRKAISMLKSAQVVSVSQGKEPVVTSIINAYKFIEENKNVEDLYLLKERFENLLLEKKLLNNKIENLFDEVINHSNKFKDISPYNPIEVELFEHSYIVGKSVSTTHFWQHTKSTVIAIRRQGKLIIAPSPNENFQINDRIVIVGDLDAVTKAIEFINNG